MPSFDVSRSLAVPAAAAWQAFVDTRLWPRWGPSIRDVQVEGGPVVGAGTTGRVRTVAGVWLPFEVTDWDEGHRWAWQVAGVAATGHRVEPLDPGRCRAVMEVPVWAPAYAGVCWLGLRRLERVAHSVAAGG